MKAKDIPFYRNEQLKDTQTKINYLSIVRQLKYKLEELDELEENIWKLADSGDFDSADYLRDDREYAVGYVNGLMVALDVLEHTLEIENEGIKYIIED